MNRNLVGSIYGRSSIKNAHFVPIRLQTWPPQAILIADWLISKKSSPLKQSSQMNRNFVGSTYRRFCIKFPQNRMKDEQTQAPPTEPLVEESSHLIFQKNNFIRYLHLVEKCSVSCVQYWQLASCLLPTQQFFSYIMARTS